jgi:inner membrane protein involved in colicin E2 resistance
VTPAWGILPVGVFGLTQGAAVWGAFFTVAGLAALVVALSTPVIRWAQARRSSRPLATLLLVSFIAFALVEVWQAARPSPLYIAPKAAALAHGLILLALTAVTAWQLMRSQPAK